MKTHPAAISKVIDGSIADEMGIEPGDILLSVNGRSVADVFEYRFLCASEELVIEIEKKSSEIWELEIEKDPDEDIGMEFVNPLLSEEKHCRNHCIFCFIDQLPPEMRESLYFKDDDARLSFLTGNYVTLTNMDDEEMEKIISYRLSPINVSVHTTNPQLRCKMLNNRHAGDILTKIRKLIESGLTVNTQIVLCRDWNDGDELDRTMADLLSLYPGVASLCVVPVGMTRFRDGLAPLRPFDQRSAQEVIEQLRKVQHKMFEHNQSRVAYASDEFFLTAGISIPDYDEYEDFPQLENGVGMIALMKKEIENRLQEIKSRNNGKILLKNKNTISIATGISAGNFIIEMSEKIMENIDITINVFPVENHFFGESVTVAGLLTGRDLIDGLKDHFLGDILVIPQCMLRSGERVFLDDLTVEDVESALHMRIAVSGNNGEDFIRTVTQF